MAIALINTDTDRSLGNLAAMAAVANICSDARLIAPPGLTAPPGMAQVMAAAGIAGDGDFTDARAFIAAGGDLFADGRARMATWRRTPAYALLSRHAPAAVVFAQSVPDACRGTSFYALRRTLSRCAAISVRDETSAQRLRAAGVKASLSYDAAFAGAPPSDAAIRAARALYDAAGVAPDAAALIAPEAFTPLSQVNPKSHLKALCATADALAARGLTPVVLIASGEADGGQRLAARQFARARPQCAVIDAIGPTPAAAAAAADPVGRVAAVIGMAAGVVTARYDVAVQRLAAGRRPVTLHHDARGRDLCARLGCDGAPADNFDATAVATMALRATDAVFDAAPLAGDLRDRLRADLRKVDAAATPKIHLGALRQNAAVVG